MTTNPPEFSHAIATGDIGAAARRLTLVADAPARAALAARFGLLALDRLEAALDIRREAGAFHVQGQVHGQGAQPCVTSGDPVPFAITETINLKLVPDVPAGGEIELSSDDLDVEPLTGQSIDVGEIAAQAFALGLDPYPRSAAPVAGLLSEEEAIAARSPFAVLKKP